MSSDRLLEKLNGVKRAGPDRWTAKCPAHEAHAQAGKWIAMALYNGGARSLATTQAAFERHREWAAA